MDELVSQWHHEGRSITFSWVGERPVTLRWVYALAFDWAGDMLLVGAGVSPDHWFPVEGVNWDGRLYTHGRGLAPHTITVIAVKFVR